MKLTEGQLVTLSAPVVFCATDSRSPTEDDIFCVRINHQLVHAIPRDTILNHGNSFPSPAECEKMPKCAECGHIESEHGSNGCEAEWGNCACKLFVKPTDQEKEKPRVTIDDVRKYAGYYLPSVGTNDPLMFLWALGLDIFRKDGTKVGDDMGGQST